METEVVNDKKNKKSTVDLTQGNIFWLLVKFTIPVIISAALQQIYSITDSVIVGQKIGDSSLASVGASTAIVNVIISVMIGFGTGASVIVSQLFGAKKYDSLKRSVSTTIILLTIPSVLISLIGFILAPQMLQIANVEPAYLADASSYLRIIFIGLVFTMLYNLYSGLLRGLGNSKMPLYFLMLSIILNIVLDWILVDYYGIAGVAIATVIATLVSCILCFIYIALKVPQLHIKYNQWCFDLKLLKKIFISSTPAAIQQLTISISILILQIIVSQYDKGTGYSIHLSAYTVGSKISNFISLPVTCIGPGATAFAAQNKGKNLMDRIVKSYKYSMILMTILIAITTIPGLLFMDDLTRLVLKEEGNPNFNAELKVIRDFLWALLPFYFFLGLQFTTNSLMRGAGDFMWPFIIMIISMLIRTVFAFVLNKIFGGYIYAFYAFPLSWFISGIWAYLRYKSNKWQNKQFIQAN